MTTRQPMSIYQADLQKGTKKYMFAQRRKEQAKRSHFFGTNKKEKDGDSGNRTQDRNKRDISLILTTMAMLIVII